MKSLAAIDSKYVNAKKMLQDKIDLVGHVISARIGDIMATSMVNYAIDSVVSKSFCDKYINGESGNPGMKITKTQSKMAVILLQRIYFKSHTAVSNLEITITDSSKTEKHYVTANADEEVVIDVDFKSSQNEITITYDGTGIEPYVYDCVKKKCCCTKTECGCPCGCSPSMKATGIDFDGTEINDLRGIRIDAVLMCDTDKMLCLVRDKIKMPIYYLVIAEIMKEWLATDRVNFLSMNSEEWVKSQITQLNASAMAMIDEAAPGISRYLERQEPKCFICKSFSQTYETP